MNHVWFYSYWFKYGFTLIDLLFYCRPTLIDLNPFELKYYPIMITLNKCTGSCNVLSPKICFSKETKDINIKTFNMINKNEAKAMTENTSCDCKWKFNSIICDSNKKWNKKTCQCECKNYCKFKKDYSWNGTTCICENNKYLKSIADTSVTECEEIIIIMDNISKKKDYSNKVTSTTLTNCHSKKIKDCYILHTVLLAIILILIIIIICYQYVK